MSNSERFHSSRYLALDEAGFSGRLGIRWCIALSAVILILGVGIIVYGKVPLPQYPQFVPLHISFVFLLDAITAWLLFGQFHYRRLPLYLLLGSAYLFNAAISVPFLLSFPGAIQTAGGVVGGPQSSIWLWHYWHIVFPTLIVISLVVHGSGKRKQVAAEKLWPLTVFAVTAVAMMVGALTLSVTSGHDTMPVLIDVAHSQPLTTVFYWVGGAAAVLSLVALGLSWFYGRGKIALHLWLSVVMIAFLVDVLASLGAHERYTVGWYFGRIEAMVAAGVLFLLFLGEMTNLYQRLGAAIQQAEESNRKLKSSLEEIRNTEIVLAKKNKELERLSKLDFLTQLNNRQSAEMRIRELTETAQRYGRPFTVTILDIDHFKQINDEFGHNVGDQVLRGLADVISKRIRITDTAARWGGEEFLIVSAETTLAHAADLAEMLRALVETGSFDLGFPVTASFGVAEYAPGDEISSLINRADHQLYVAKKLGRNRVVAA